MNTIWLSLFILILLYFTHFFGFTNRRMHMLSAWIVIIVDSALVLWLAIGRNVLEKLNDDVNWLLIVHILLALSCLFFYFLAAKYGIKLSKGDENYRRKMRLISIVILPIRSLVFITILIIKLNAN